MRVCLCVYSTAVEASASVSDSTCFSEQNKGKKVRAYEARPSRNGKEAVQGKQARERKKVILLRTVEIRSKHFLFLLWFVCVRVCVYVVMRSPVNGFILVDFAETADKRQEPKLAIRDKNKNKKAARSFFLIAEEDEKSTLAGLRRTTK